MADQQGFGGKLARLPHHQSLYRFTPLLAGHANYCHICHLGVLKEHGFHLGGIDIFATGNDHVFHPVMDVEKAVAIQITGITGVIPAVLQGIASGIFPAPVAFHDRGRLYQYLPHLIRGQCVTQRIHHPDLDTGHGPATGFKAAGTIARITDPMFIRRQERHAAGGFGHAVQLHKIRIEQSHGPPQQIFRNGRGTVQHHFYMAETFRRALRILHNKQQQRRYGEQFFYLVLLHQPDQLHRLRLGHDHIGGTMV